MERVMKCKWCEKGIERTWISANQRIPKGYWVHLDCAMWNGVTNQMDKEPLCEDQTPLDDENSLSTVDG